MSAKSFVQVFVREDGRGLVHDQDPRLHRHGFGNLYDLALRRAEAGRAPPHIDPLKPDVLQDLLHAVRLRCPRRSTEPKRPVGMPPSRTFSVTLRLGTRLACWATMRMPSCWPRSGLVIACGSPARSNFACVGLHRAGQDARERALARAVLADDGMHFAALGRKVDRAQRLRAPEALADTHHV